MTLDEIAAAATAHQPATPAWSGNFAFVLIAALARELRATLASKPLVKLSCAEELWDKFLAFAERELASGGYVSAMECSEPRFDVHEYGPYARSGTVTTTFAITFVSPVKAEMP